LLEKGLEGAAWDRILAICSWSKTYWPGSVEMA
jgi:hypothetical protein